MTKAMIKELLEIQRRGIEPFFTAEGGVEYYRLLMELEDENEVEVSA